MSEAMQQVVEALDTRWEGEALAAYCQVCQPYETTGKRHLYVKPPDRDSYPTFDCHREHPWPELRRALREARVPVSALRGSAPPPPSIPEPDGLPDNYEPLPDEIRLDKWTEQLFDAGFQDFREYLRAECGLSDEQIRAAGLGARTRDGRDPRISIPVRDVAGDVVAVRLWNPLHPDRARRKTWLPGHGGVFLLGAHKVAGWPADEPVVVCEGESDYLAATASGLRAVAVTAGALAVPGDLRALAQRRVVVCFDNDAPGRQGASKLAAALADAGEKKVWVADLGRVLPEDGADVRDWLRSRTAADFRTFLGEVLAGEPFDPVAAAEAEAVDLERTKERRRREARRAVDSEEALSAWEEPPFLEHMGLELDIEDEPLQWLVEGLHPTGMNTLVAAQYKTGKTTLVINLMKALVDGEPFLDHYKTALPDGGRVGWWNYELDTRQARRWVRERVVEHPERISHLPLRGYRMPLQAPVLVDWAVTWLRERHIRVWVLDPFGAAYDGDENDNSAVRVWLQHLDEIKRRAGVDDVFLIAHTGRAEQAEGQERARGATRLDDWADVRWTYTSSPKVPELRWLAAHGRDVEEPVFPVEYSPLSRTLLRASDEQGSSRSEVVRHRLAELVTQVVTQRPGINKGDLREALGKGTNTEKDAAVALAAQQGAIYTVPGKQRSVLHYPVIPGEPQVGDEPGA